MPDQETGNAAGGGNTGDGSGTNNAGITEDRVNEIVNKAIAGAIKGRDEKVAQRVVESILNDDSALMQKIGEIETKAKESGTQQKPGKKRDDAEIPDELQQRLNDLEKNNQKLQKNLEDRENKLRQKEQAEINDQRNKIQTQALEQAGFKSRQKGVAALHRNDGILKWEAENENEVGKPVIEVDGIDVPYADWLNKHFVKSDEGKSYLDAPPRDGTGAGGMEAVSGNWASGDGKINGKDISTMTGKETLEAFNGLTGR